MYKTFATHLKSKNVIIYMKWIFFEDNSIENVIIWVFFNTCIVEQDTKILELFNENLRFFYYK